MRRTQLYSVFTVSTLLTALLLWLLALPGTAQQIDPLADEPTGQSTSADSKNFTLLGIYSGTNGFVGEAISVGIRPYAYVYASPGVAVLDIRNPAAVQQIGGRAISGPVEDIEGTAYRLYVMNRDGYVEMLSTSPLTAPTFLRSYTPAESGYFFDMVNFPAPGALFLAHSDGVTVLSTVNEESEGTLPVLGNYATDITRNLLLSGERDLLVADTDKAVELLTVGPTPSLLGKLERGSKADAIALVGNTLYRATGTALEVIDITKRASPVLVRRIHELGNLRAMKSGGSGLLYTAGRPDKGIRAYFASDPHNLIELGHYQDDDFYAKGLDLWTELYATGGTDGMRILQYDGERPRFQARVTVGGVQIDGADWSVGQTRTFTQPFTIRLAQAVASLDLEGRCEGVLRILMALQPISEESFDPFEVFVELLDLSPTLCEPARPQPVARSAADTVTEARIDLRLDSGGLKLTQGDMSIFQNVKTPVATTGSRGLNSFAVSHDADSGATTVRSYTGNVTVTPQGDGLAPLTLSAGQEVDVTASAVGEVKQAGGLFLPWVMR